MSHELKTPDEWLATPEYAGLIVHDPDGWRQGSPSGAMAWDTPLTYDDFQRRLMLCTLDTRNWSGGRR